MSLRERGVSDPGAHRCDLGPRLRSRRGRGAGHFSLRMWRAPCAASAFEWQWHLGREAGARTQRAAATEGTACALRVVWSAERDGAGAVPCTPARSMGARATRAMADLCAATELEAAGPGGGVEGACGRVSRGVGRGGGWRRVARRVRRGGVRVVPWALHGHGALLGVALVRIYRKEII